MCFCSSVYTQQRSRLIMRSSWSCYFASIVLIGLSTYNVICPVKSQPTAQCCGNGDSSSNIVAELNVEIVCQLTEQVQSMRQLFTESIQEMKNQQNSIMKSLQATDRRLDEHDTSLQNLTQNWWKLSFGLPVQLVQVVIDTRSDPVLLPIVNNWIILMHRFDGSVNFYRNWTEYRNGFGDVGRGEFWLGNDRIHRLTKKGRYTLRIEVQLNGTGGWYYADYETFSIDSESSLYALRLSGFSGNALDSLTNTSRSNAGGYLGGKSFQTFDTGVCARIKLGGWWFDNCALACLTCSYKQDTFRWHSLAHVSPNGQLRAARMMMKSK